MGDRIVPARVVASVPPSVVRGVVRSVSRVLRGRRAHIRGRLRLRRARIYARSCGPVSRLDDARGDGRSPLRCCTATPLRSRRQRGAPARASVGRRRTSSPGCQGFGSPLRERITGVSEYLMKERVGRVEELLDALDRVAAGGCGVDRAIVEELLARRRQGEPARHAHAARARDPRLDRRGPLEPRHQPDSLAKPENGRDAYQGRLHQARTHGGARGQPARARRSRLPGTLTRSTQVRPRFSATVMWQLLRTTPKGVDRAAFLITMRRSRTGPGLPLSLRGPLFTLPRADLSPQPPADVRICRDVVLLHGCRSARRGRGGSATCTLAGRPQAADSNARRSRSRNCRQRSRSAISLGRLLAGEWLRLLGARLLDVRPARHRTPTQFLRVV